MLAFLFVNRTHNLFYVECKSTETNGVSSLVSKNLHYPIKFVINTSWDKLERDPTKISSLWEAVQKNNIAYTQETMCNGHCTYILYICIFIIYDNAHK